MREGAFVGPKGVKPVNLADELLRLCRNDLRVFVDLCTINFLPVFDAIISYHFSKTSRFCSFFFKL